MLVTDRGFCIKRYCAERRIKHKSRLLGLTERKCARCGYNEFLAALDFHHVDPRSKEFKMGNLVGAKNFDLALKEADKCVVLCTCCHRGLEARQWTAEFFKLDGLGYGIARWWLTDPDAQIPD